MKLTLLLFTFLLTQQFCAQIPEEIAFDMKGNPIETRQKPDSTILNYYVENNQDTVWFDEDAVVVHCNFMASLEKSHNHCII